MSVRIGKGARAHGQVQALRTTYDLRKGLETRPIIIKSFPEALRYAKEFSLDRISFLPTIIAQPGAADLAAR